MGTGSPMAVALVSGAAAGVAADMTQQGLDIATGKQNHYSVKQTVISGTVGAATAGVLQKVAPAVTPLLPKAVNKFLNSSGKFYSNAANTLNKTLRNGTVSTTGPLSTSDIVGVRSLSDFVASESTAFSGVYDAEIGAFQLRPSGNTINNTNIPTVPRAGGHRIIDNELTKTFGASDKRAGFTLFYGKEGELSIEFFSRSVNGKNFGDNIAPKAYQEQITKAVEQYFNVKVTPKN